MLDYPFDRMPPFFSELRCYTWKPNIIRVGGYLSLSLSLSLSLTQFIILMWGCARLCLWVCGCCFGYDGEAAEVCKHVEGGGGGGEEYK